MLPMIATRASRVACLAPHSIVARAMSSWNIAGASGGEKFVIKTINAISPEGLARYPEDSYEISDDSDVAHAIMLRSHKLQESDVPISCRAIARCGAGTNNCNVPRMTELGIPVFNTPGANANSVKELTLCGLFMASRGIVAGTNHMKSLHEQGIAAERVEKDKKMFAGRELKGKTLGVVGLGAIGAAVTEAALDLGMKVIGFDPALSVEAALRLPGQAMKHVDDLGELMALSDYISIHAPYIPNVTHHLISAEMIGLMKKDASLLNFARGELVDTEALANHYDNGGTGTYVCDFPVQDLWERDNVIAIPHLGASTEEAESNAAAMAADTLQTFLETGEIVNSVNFPTTKLPPRPDIAVRICIVNENKPGVLGKVLDIFGEKNINVLQQINTSRGEIAVTVIDVDRDITKKPVDAVPMTAESWEEMQIRITNVDGVKTTRLIMGQFGAGYAVKINNEIHVHGRGEKTYAELA